MRIKAPTLIFSLILLLGLFLRSYQLPKQAIFDADEEYNANFAKSVATVYPIQLIGQGISAQGLFVGPWYYYYLTPFLLATRLAPIGQYYGSVLLSLVTIAAYFLFVRGFAGPKAGLLAAFLRAVLNDRVIQDLATTPAFACDGLVLITWWLLDQYWHHRYRYFALLGLVFGLYTSIHPALFPFYFIFLAIFFIKRKFPGWRNLTGAVLMLFLAISPLILFEYFHRFLEIKELFALNRVSTAEVKTFGTFVDYLSLIFHLPSGLIGQFLPEGLRNFLDLGVWIAIALQAYRKEGFWKDQFHKIFFLLVVLVYPVYYVFLPVHAPDYYFLGVKVTLFVYLTAGLILLWQNRVGRLVVSLVLISIIIWNFSQTHEYLTRSNQVSLFDKENVLAEIERRAPDNKIILLVDTDPGRAFGFPYLIAYRHIFVRSGDNDPVYTIYVPKSRAKNTPLVYTSGDIGLSVKEHQ